LKFWTGVLYFALRGVIVSKLQPRIGAKFSWPRTAAAWSVAGVVMMSSSPGIADGNQAAPARPGHVAEAEELDAARAQGTVVAYDLFLARHPDGRYAGQARKERAALAAGNKK
jgi:hypothetical protein